MTKKAALALFILMFSGLANSAKAATEKLDNIAACAGVVIGNGAIDLFMGNEKLFDDAADIAYSAYLSVVFSSEHNQNDLQVADQILGGNLDKVINAYNSETFDNELYEEIVGCYRALSKQILHASEIIEKNQDSWIEVKSNSINTLKRMLKAG
tara:strand:- start:172 stop:633 length:462 start_codon:yes stop_codon:yes gene_type:complete